MWVVIDRDVGLTLGLISEMACCEVQAIDEAAHLAEKTLGNIPFTNSGNKLAITSTDHEAVVLIELIVCRQQIRIFYFSVGVLVSFENTEIRPSPTGTRPASIAVKSKLS